MASIKEQEQARMDMVVTKVKEAIAKDQANLASVEADKKAIQADFSNNVRIKTSTYSGMMETALTVRQQQQLLQERENNMQQASRRLEILEKLEKKPYFARIDFEEEGEGKEEKIYIGLGSFTDGPDKFLIYDWRAPISSIYYDGGGLGEVSYQTPDGERKVDLRLKRQFMVEDGKISVVFDTDETVGDQMLLEVLDENSDTKMKSIVTTIQREQNKIIRDTSSDLLFVQGAAGSGKTSAVLQRVAFLLYRYRGKLTSSQVILFSPNQLFNDYIDQVLPELGEQNMVQLTYYQHVKRRLPKLHVETLQERFEEDQAPLKQKVKRLKDSLDFFKASKAYGAYLERKGMRFKDLKLGGEVFFSKAHIKQIYYSFNENYHLRNRLEATKERLVKELNGQINRYAKSDQVQKAIQDLSQEQLNALYGDHPRNFANGEKELNFLGRQYVMHAFKPLHQAIIKNRFLGINGQYVHFLKSVPALVDLAKYDLTKEEWQLELAQVVADLKAKKLALSDVTAYLFLYDQISGKRGQIDIKQVFIDEIQDYTAYQLAYLKEEFPRAKFTMLGDLNQAIFTHENSHSLLKELGTMFPQDKTKVVQLTKSYRSTQQITDFTKEILLHGEAVTAFERAGEKPRLTTAKTEADLIADVVARLKQNQADRLTTAVIGKSLAECEALTQALRAEGQAVTLIKTENQRLAAGTIVVPAYLAKGLEFDAVIMWQANAKNYHADSDRQLVYTICSRAMHRLDIFVSGQVTPLFDRIDPKLYELIAK